MESQSLELHRQQTDILSAGLEEKKLFFTKISEGFALELQQGHDWLNSYKLKTPTTNPATEHSINSSERSPEYMGGTDGASHKRLKAQAELEELKTRRLKLEDEHAKSKQLLVHLEQKNEAFPPALKTLDMEALQEEHRALLADEAGELEYLKSLEDQINQVKSVAHAVKCQCGEEYVVGLVA